MKFIIERRLLIKMVEQTRRGTIYRPNRDPCTRLCACAARLFVIGPMVTVGHETLVLEDGECWVTTRQFLGVLRTFTGQEILTIEVRDALLHIARFRMPIIDFNPDAEPPADFQVFRVTDLNVLAGPQPHLNKMRAPHRHGG